MHVWRRDADKQWVYDTYLTVLPLTWPKPYSSNPVRSWGLMKVAYQCLGRQRQKQRRKLVRTEPNGKVEELYKHPIVGAFTTADGQTIAVDSEALSSAGKR